MIGYVRANRIKSDVITYTNTPLIISDDDAIWLMRMCVGEGGFDCSSDKASAMLWSMVNRWFLHPGRKHWPRFKFLLRRFSQPINPRWARGGDLAEKYKNTRFAEPSRLKRRDRMSNLELSEIPEIIRQSVHLFREGRLFPPERLVRMNRPRISNWASLPSTPRRYPWGVDIGGDWFFEDEHLHRGAVVVKEL